jgi:predicted XRE-type DNA-binding protein
MASAEVQSLPQRLRQVQMDVDDAEEALKHRREQRRRLVVQIVDEGAMSQRQVARALGDKSPGLVVAILAQPGPDDE